MSWRRPFKSGQPDEPPPLEPQRAGGHLGLSGRAAGSQRDRRASPRSRSGARTRGAAGAGTERGDSPAGLTEDAGEHVGVAVAAAAAARAAVGRPPGRPPGAGAGG